MKVGRCSQCSGRNNEFQSNWLKKNNGMKVMERLQHHFGWNVWETRRIFGWMGETRATSTPAWQMVDFLGWDFVFWSKSQLSGQTKHKLWTKCSGHWARRAGPGPPWDWRRGFFFLGAGHTYPHLDEIHAYSQGKNGKSDKSWKHKIDILCANQSWRYSIRRINPLQDGWASHQLSHGKFRQSPKSDAETTSECQHPFETQDVTIGRADWTMLAPQSARKDECMAWFWQGLGLPVSWLMRDL
jgi:hypothetical protein